MHYDRTQRIRRAAILVASLEETLAEQMLENLPRLEAARILDEVDRLGELDQEEVEDVLDEFRSAGRYGRGGGDSVDFTYSAPAPVGAAVEPATATGGADDVDEAQQQAEAVLMAELLGREHPQTIAAALSRLEHGRGALVFAELPSELQAEVLERLAKLEPVDEAAVADLETQLSQRVAQQRQRREQAAASAELARQMLAKMAPVQRELLLARLAAGGSAARVTTGSESRMTIESTAVQPSGMPLAARASADYLAEERYEAVVEDESAASVPPAPASVALPDRSRELESLRDGDLLEALRLADERTVHCALAASSDRFLKRVAGKLPRRDASRLRQAVRSIGPTRLADLREAQHVLLRLALQGRGSQPAPR